MKLNLTDKEQVFVTNIMKPFEDITGLGIDLELLIKVLKQTLQGCPSTAAIEMISILIEKISMYQASVEIEKFLSDPDYGTQKYNTKNESYYKLTNFNQKHLTIVELLKKYPGLSRREIAAQLRVPINQVTPRVHELIEMGRVGVSGTKYDYKTNRNVETLKVVGNE